MVDKRKIKIGMRLLIIILFCSASLVQATVPHQTNYQGRLTYNTGTPLNGTFTMRFYLYDALADGTLLWDEQQSVVVTNGIYNVRLGSVNPLDFNDFAGDEVYLEVAIYNADTAEWETFSPRQRFTSTAYAFQAENASFLEGHASADFAPEAHQHSGADITSGTVDEKRIDPDMARDTEITWSNLAGIPSDIADGDQVGISIETDPTVAASVKDGVSWGELSDIPPGFADGVDNNSGGDITGVVAGTGLSGGGASGRVTLNVNVPLTLSGSDAEGIVSVTNTYAGGYAVYGEASNSENVENYGGYFTASGRTGKGVYGFASGYIGRGVSGEASGVSGYGVIGSASGTMGYGVYGHASGTYGQGVVGWASNTGDVENRGGYFRAYGTNGQGVHAEVIGSAGQGVYGFASNSEDVENYGGYFMAYGGKGRGLYGYTIGDNGIGVYGRATGINSTGVWANGGKWDFYAAGPGENYGPFTGAHEVRFTEEMPGEIRPGMIVSVTGRAEVRKKENGEISFSSTLPTVTLARKAMDKAVLGVLVSEGPLHEDHWYEGQEGERFGVVNALGEGRVLVTNVNGNIEAGDYITSSPIPGYGQKQDDDLLHSYSLGKAIETVDWESVTETIEYNGVSHKVYPLAVVYTSG